MAPRRRLSSRERGFLLLGVLTTILVMGILAGVVMQDWSVIEKREREAQLLFIQEQYAAAILAYQTAQGALPTDLEQLTKKGGKGEVFLRRAYVDPMTRGAKLEDWCLLRMAGTGQVVSSCAAQGEGQAGGTGLGDTTGDATDRFGSKSSSSSRFGGDTQGAGTSRTTGSNPGSTFGGGTSTTMGGGIGAGAGTGVLPGAGAGAGTAGIVGVHSKSHDKAFNTVKRNEETYDRWYYTVEDYKKEVTMRNIPGMPPRNVGPGLNNQQGTPGTQGQQGTSPFGNDPFSTSGKKGTTGGSQQQQQQQQQNDPNR